MAWVIKQSRGPIQCRSATRTRQALGTALALEIDMTSACTIHGRHYARVALIALLLLGGGVPGVGAQPTGVAVTFTTSWTRLEHVEHAIERLERQERSALRPTWTRIDTSSRGRRWPLRADPRQWPRVLANTTECTLSFDPVLRRHWWQ